MTVVKEVENALPENSCPPGIRPWKFIRKLMHQALGKCGEQAFMQVITTGCSVSIIKSTPFEDKPLKHDVVNQKQYTKEQAAKRARKEMRYISNCQAAHWHSAGNCMLCGWNCSEYHRKCQECKRYICEDCSSKETERCLHCFPARYDNSRTPAYNQETVGKKYCEDVRCIAYREYVKQKLLTYSTHVRPERARRPKGLPFVP